MTNRQMDDDLIDGPTNFLFMSDNDQSAMGYAISCCCT